LTPAIHVEGLTKSYGAIHAVRGIGFTVEPGEVFGLLGPNGAGKTTTVEILEGLRTRDGGAVSVLGFDPERHSRQLKDQIGVALQATNLPDKIRVIEAVELFASFYSRTLDLQKLLERLHLWDRRSSFYHALSGGQKQRLALALALVNDPQVLFLDEPTSGLDPQARREIHALIGELRAERRTVVLTTHYIEEAERLCDSVAIIDGGRIIARGTPGEIQRNTLGHTLVEVGCSCPLPEDGQPGWSENEHVSFNPERTRITVNSPRPARALVELVRWIDQAGIELEDVRLKHPTLEDVFIELTGRRLRE